MDDRDFLLWIGGNLKGLEGYIREAWEAHNGELSLWPGHGGESAVEILLGQVRRLRLPFDERHVRDRLRGMFARESMPAELEELLGALWRDPPALEKALQERGEGDAAAAIRRALERELQALTEYEAFLAKVKGAGAERHPELDEQFRQLLWQWFRRKIVVVENYYISGNGLVSRICDDTPPGYLNRIMGIQNIKGTGLDFVYRWCAWESCHRCATALGSRDPAEAERGLRGLATFQDFGYLSEELVREALEKVKTTSFAQSERVQAELAMVASNMEKAMARLREESGAASAKRGRLHAVLDIVEGFLEPGDSVKRRKTANRIYRGLVAGRIGAKRAEVEVKALTQRQKGGWLARAVEGMRRKLSETVAAPPRQPESRKEPVRA